MPPLSAQKDTCKGFGDGWMKRCSVALWSGLVVRMDLFFFRGKVCWFFFVRNEWGDESGPRTTGPLRGGPIGLSVLGNYVRFNRNFFLYKRYIL